MKISIDTTDLIGDLSLITNIIRENLDHQWILSCSQVITFANNQVYVDDCVVSRSFLGMVSEVYSQGNLVHKQGGQQ